MRPRNWCGAAAAVVACLLSAGCTSVSPHAGVGAAGAASSTPASTVTPALVSSTFGGVNFPHPAAWREVWPETQGAGPSYVIGYLTNQPAGSTGFRGDDHHCGPTRDPDDFSRSQGLSAECEL
jgi:hypothetical protein